MKIDLNFIGENIIEMRCENNTSSITEELTNLFGIVDEEFILNLKDIIDSLEQHNEKINTRDNNF